MICNSQEGISSEGSSCTIKSLPYMIPTGEMTQCLLMANTEQAGATSVTAEGYNDTSSKTRLRLVQTVTDQINFAYTSLVVLCLASLEQQLLHELC